MKSQIDNEKGGIKMEYKIIPEREHVIITDTYGKFVCSCDNYKETEQEIKKMEVNNNE